MFFGQLFKRLRNQPYKQSIERSPAVIDQKASEIKNLITDHPASKVLEKANNSIQSRREKNQLKPQRAETLSKKEKTCQASKPHNEIAKPRNRSRTSNTSKQLLTRTDQLQASSPSNKTEDLIKELHECAANYEHQLTNAPESKHQISEPKIILFVRREARIARSNEQPKLSLDLIETTLQAGNESPWLHHDKALTLYMMGQHVEAIKILSNIEKVSNGVKIKNSIYQNIEKITRKPNRYKSKINHHLAKQAFLITKSQNSKAQVIPEFKNIKPKDNVKLLILKEARIALRTNLELSHLLIDLILAYFPEYCAALQLKGEALASQNESEKALQIWQHLSHSKNTKAVLKASESISQIIAKKAREFITKTSPEEVVAYYIRQSIEYEIPPSVNKEIECILKVINPPGNDLSDPELLKHHFQLQLNTQAIEYFEILWRNKHEVDTSALAQKPSTISKTSPKEV